MLDLSQGRSSPEGAARAARLKLLGHFFFALYNNKGFPSRTLIRLHIEGEFQRPGPAIQKSVQKRFATRRADEGNGEGYG